MTESFPSVIMRTNVEEFGMPDQNPFISHEIKSILGIQVLQTLYVKVRKKTTDETICIDVLIRKTFISAPYGLRDGELIMVFPRF